MTESVTEALAKLADLLEGGPLLERRLNDTLGEEALSEDPPQLDINWTPLGDAVLDVLARLTRSNPCQRRAGR